MKVYILYSKPHDEGAEVYGVFSSKERVEAARDVFQPASNYELYVSEFLLDGLEIYFERAKSGYHLYLGYKHGSSDWDISRAGLDAILEPDFPKSSASDWGTHFFGQAWARSKEEALGIIEKIVSEKKDGYYKWEK